MRLAEHSLRNPAAVGAAAAIVLLFGVLALLRLPIQLLPDTRQPELSINASWREAAPAELEEAIIEPPEEAMRGLPGLVEMRSESNRGRGGVGLTFEVGTNMTRVMLDVVSCLNALLPDVDEPQVFGGDNWQSENAASLLLRPLPGHEAPDIAVQYQRLVEEVIEPRLARVPGVSRVTFDPHRLAALGITPQRLAQTVIAARDVSAGFADVGRRQFTVRVTGREPIADLGGLVVGWSDDRPLYLRDVADVRGQLTSITDYVDAAETRAFGYDAKGRLTTANGPWGNGTVTYDALDNLRAQALGGRSIAVAYDAATNRVSGATDAGNYRPYAYDARGNATTVGPLTLGYDFANQPTSVTGGTSASYAYDGHLKRVKSVAGGKTVYSVYSALGGSVMFRDEVTDGKAMDYLDRNL